MADAGAAPVRVLISGAAGQIGYALIPLVATGQVFGSNQPVILHLLDIEPAMAALSGVVMEIEDGSYPLVHGIFATSDYDQAFKDVDYCILVGGFPRKKGMLRADLLAKNAPIFIATGQALEKHAKKSVKVLVVANPANTNALTCAANAPSIPNENFCALTRLDYNRAKGQLARKLGVTAGQIKNVIIWGNHSKSMVPDVSVATVTDAEGQTKKITDLVDSDWLKTEFRQTIQQRGAAIIKARGLSSAMSAANATKDCLRDWHLGTPAGEHVAMSIITDGKLYGVEKGLIYSMPCTVKDGKWAVVEDYKPSEEIQALMKVTEKELLDERKEVSSNDYTQMFL